MALWLYFSLTWDTQLVGSGWAGSAHSLATKPNQATVRPDDEPLPPAFGEVARGQQLSRNGLAAGHVWRGAMVNFSMAKGNLALTYRPDIPPGGQSGRSKLAKSRDFNECDQNPWGAGCGAGETLQR